MALVLGLGLPVPTFHYSPTRVQSQTGASPVHGQGLRTFCLQTVANNLQACDQKIVRRSASYQPPIWDYDYVQSLNNKYAGSDAYAKQVAKLKEDVKLMLGEVRDPLDGLEMIDDLQRLGVFYHFEEEIDTVLESIYNNKYDELNKEDLHGTALKFRLLRQHGYNIPQGVFNNFKDEARHFDACLCDDTRGMLYLYEASYLSIRDESILEEARDFTTKNLKRTLEMKDINEDLALMVSHALELPLHWRMPRLEARWFIDMYERRQDMNPTLLELAKLDFNMVQTTHQEDLKHMSMWWSGTGLGTKLEFARDRLMENFLWTIGLNFTPQFSNLRRNMTVVNALITTIDDVYDVYGTMDELEIFTNAIERWDTSVVEHLPDYMKICFLALFNSINQIGYDVLKEQGAHIIPHLQKSWADLCKSYLVEAKWYYSGYKPTLEEYMNNAWVSISAPAILTHAYFITANPITPEGSECSQKYPNIFQWSGTVLRLADDLGTSSDEMKRGDNPKFIQCYMHETGASEEDAREHVKYLIGETWKKMNEDRFADSPFSQTLVEIAMNLARMSQCMYQYGDGHAAQVQETKDRVLSLLINPIPLKYLER